MEDQFLVSGDLYLETEDLCYYGSTFDESIYDYDFDMIDMEDEFFSIYEALA